MQNSTKQAKKVSTHRILFILIGMIAHNPRVVRALVLVVADFSHVRPKQRVTLARGPDALVRLQEDHRVRRDIVHKLYVLQRRFPVIPVGRIEKVVTHLACRDALHHVARLERIDDHSVDLLLPPVHLHFALVGKQLPPVASIAYALASLVQLLCADSVDFRPQLVGSGLHAGSKVLRLLLVIVSLLVGGENGTGRADLRLHKNREKIFHKVLAEERLG